MSVEARLTDITILGGGFAGIRAAHLLSQRREVRNCFITLIDRGSMHVNTPGLYEIASAFVPWEREGVGQVMRDAAGVSFQNVLDGTGVRFFQAAVTDIRPSAQTILVEGGKEHHYGLLLIALGAQTATMNIPGVHTLAFGVKTFHEAAEVRHHIVSLFLRHRTASRRTQQRAFTICVVGGGSAGVETAAELRLFQQKLARLHRVDPSIPRVLLYEASDTILRECPVRLQHLALERLRALGVQIHTRQAIKAVHADRVDLGDGTAIPTETTIWLAGIRTHDLLLRSGLPTHPRGGLIVDETLEVHGQRHIFAAGDCVYMTNPETGQTVPDVTWAALQQGTIVAENMARRLEGRPLVAYLPHPRPVLTTVGGRYALVHLPPFQFAGRTGWIMKQLVDLFYLFRILPNSFAFRSWLRSLRVRIANDTHHR